MEIDRHLAGCRKKWRRQQRVLNAIIVNVFKLTTTPVPGLRKAKDYFYEA
jgi:hypothetical protein